MKRILALCSVLLALALPTSAWATCNWFWWPDSGKIPTTGPFVLEFDGVVKDVDANAPKGTILLSQTYTGTKFVGYQGLPTVQCTDTMDYFQRVVTTGASLGVLYGQYTYESGLPGIGIRVIGNAGDAPFDGQMISLGVDVRQAQWGGDVPYTVELVKLTDGPLTAMGSITGNIAEWRLDQGGMIPAILYKMKTPIIIQPRVPTCTVSTPDVVVSLDQKAPGDFASVGSAVGEKDFKVSLACSGGDPNTSTNMHMFMTDQTTQSNQTSILSLTSGSTASGVGVQILNGATPIVFGQTSDAPTTDITRNIVVGTPTIDIPLKARYVRTGNMTAGSVTAIATFTVDYK